MLAMERECWTMNLPTYGGRSVSYRRGRCVWAVMVQHSRSMASMDGMDMGLGTIESFARDLGRDDGGDDAALGDPWSSSSPRNGPRTAKWMARSPLECLRARTSVCG